ncbi:uncharacterized protein LOC144124906 [Amblyomma americanum]
MTASRTELTPGTKEAAPADTEVVEYEGQLVEREVPSGLKAETEPSVVEAQDLKTEADSKADHEEPHVEKDLSQPKVESELPEAATQPDLLAPSSAPSADNETVQHEGEELQQQMQSGAQVEIEAPLPQDQDHKTEAAPGTEPQLHHLEEDSSKTKVETEIPMTASQTELTLDTKEAAPANTEVVEYEGQLVERGAPSDATAGKGAPLFNDQELKTEADAKADHDEHHVAKDSTQPGVEIEQLVASTPVDVLLGAKNSAASADKETLKNEGQLIEKGLSESKLDTEVPLPENTERRSENVEIEEIEAHPENTPAESDDFLPEGIPDPVAGLADFIEDEDALSGNVPSTRAQNEELNVEVPYRPGRPEKDRKKQEDYEAIEEALVQLEVKPGIESTPMTTGEKAAAVDTVAQPVSETATFMPEPSAKFDSSEAIPGLKTPPLVTEEPAHPITDSLELGKKANLEGSTKVLPIHDTPMAQISVSEAEGKVVPENKDAAAPVTELVEYKPEDSEKDQTVQAPSESKSPLESGAELAASKGAAGLECNKQEDYEGIEEALRHLEEKSGTEATPIITEEKTATVDNVTQPVSETVTYIPDRSEKVDSSEAVSGRKTPPLVTEESAHPITGSLELGKKGNLEGSTEVLPIHETPMSQISVSYAEGKVVLEKDAVAPVMELVEYKPEDSVKDRTVQAPSESKPPLESEGEVAAAKAAAGLEYNKQEDYEGIEEALRQLEEKPGTDATLTTTEGKTAAVDTVLQPVSETVTFIPERSERVDSSEAPSGWKTPPLVTEEPALPIIKETDSIELGKQEDIEGSTEVLPIHETPMAQMSVSEPEGKVAPETKDAATPVMKLVECKPEDSEKDQTVQAPSVSKAPLESGPEVAARKGAAGLECNKQEDYEGIEEALRQLEEKTGREATPTTTEEKTAADDAVAQPVSETVTFIPERSERIDSSEALSGWKTPPLVTEEPALPIIEETDSIELCKHETIEGSTEVLPIHETPMAQISVSEAEGKVVPENKDATAPVTELVEYKQEDSEKDQTVQAPSDSKPPLESGAEFAAAQGAANLECNKQEDYEGIEEALRQLEEKPGTEATPTTTEEKTAAVDTVAQPVSETVTFIPERSERVDSSEALSGWKTPPLVKEEPALPIIEETDSTQPGKHENIEGSAEVLPIHETPMTQILMSDTEVKVVPENKDAVAPGMELVEYKPEDSEKDQTVQAPSESKPPLESGAEVDGAKGAANYVWSKQEDYEGIEEALRQLEEKPGTEATPTTTEEKTAAVDTIAQPVSEAVTFIPERSEKVDSSEALSGWKIPPLVTEEPAFPIIEETDSIEIGKQENIESSTEVLPVHETPMAQISASEAEGKVLPENKDAVAPIMEFVEYKPEDSEKDRTVQAPSESKAPLESGAEVAAGKGAAGLECNKQEDYEGIEEALRQLEGKPGTEETPTTTEEKTGAVDNAAQPVSEKATSTAEHAGETPALVMEEPALPIIEATDFLDLGKQENFVGSREGQPILEKHMDQILVCDVEAKTGPENKDVAPVMELVEYKPEDSKKDETSQAPSESKPSLPLESGAEVAAAKRAVTAEYSKQEDYEGLEEALRQLKEKPETDTTPTAAEEKTPSVDKDVSLPHAEAVTCIPGRSEEGRLFEDSSLVRSGEAGESHLVDTEVEGSSTTAEQKRAFLPEPEQAAINIPQKVRESEDACRDSSSMASEGRKKSSIDKGGKLPAAVSDWKAVVDSSVHRGNIPEADVKAATAEVVDTSLPTSPSGAWAHEERPWFPALRGEQLVGMPNDEVAPAVPTDKEKPLSSITGSDLAYKNSAESFGFAESLSGLRRRSDSLLRERRMEANVYYVHSLERCGPAKDERSQEPGSGGQVQRDKSLEGSVVTNVSRGEQVVTDDQPPGPPPSGQSEGGKMFTVTESVSYQRLVSEVNDTESLPKLPKRKGRIKDQPDSVTAVQTRSFKFSAPPDVSGNSADIEDSSARVKFTTLKAASTSTGNLTSRLEKTDITNEEVVYFSSDAGSPRGRLTSVKKSSSCCLVRIDDDEDDSGEPGLPSGSSRPGLPPRQTYFDFKANFQRAVAVPYAGELPESAAECKQTRFLSASISRHDDESDSSRRSSDKGGTGKRRDSVPHRDPYDKSWDAMSTPGPSGWTRKTDVDPEATELLDLELSQEASLKGAVNPPCHASEVQSLLACTLCGQSFFRSNPTHAEMCSGYHKERPVPEATSGTPTPPTPECLERYVLSVVDEDDVSDVLRQAWRDHETAMLASAVWSLYRCVPNAFFIIREREKRPTSRGEVCASACIITFGDEVSFCGFFHVSRERGNTGLSRMLWNRMLAACQGKNVCTVMPQERAAPFMERYHFHASGWGDVIYCHLTLRQGRFPAPPSGGGVIDVRDFDVKRDAEAVVEYDRSVFGFDRGYFLRVALAEEDQAVKVATAAPDGRVVGYVGVQKDHRARPALRWLLADGDEAALSLMHAVVESCPKIHEVGLVGAFYAASHAAGVILNSVDKDFMEPWTLLYSKREPFLRYDKIVSLTYI